MARTLASTISRLKGVRAALVEPVGFFEQQRGAYRVLAERVTVDFLLPMLPDGIEASEWENRVRVLADAVAVDLLDGAEAGLRIHLSAEPRQPLLGEEITGPAPGVFGIETVRDWVAAGREGEEIGKQIDDRDVGRSDEQIAQRVWWALYTGRSANSGEKIRQFLTAKQIEMMREHLPSLLQAWIDALLPKVRRDYRAWVRGVIREGGVGAEPF